MFSLGAGCAITGLGFYLLKRNHGWFEHNWLTRQVPNFVMANGVGLMIPLWVWRDVLAAMIVISVVHELIRAKQRRTGQKT